MQHFDGEIDKRIRAGIVEVETGLTYSTNAGNLRLEMADFLEDRQHPNRTAASRPAAHDPNRTTEIEIERQTHHLAHVREPKEVYEAPGSLHPIPVARAL